MFPFLRFAMQVLLKKHSLQNPEDCRRFLRDLLSFLKPLADSSETKIDDKLLESLEFLLANDNLYEYFYRLVKSQFSSDEILFESVDEKLIVKCLNENIVTDSRPEAIGPVAIISLITQVLVLINSLKSS